jgi:ABC-2 type transport system permease protein
MKATQVNTTDFKLTSFRSPKAAVGRFVAKRTARSAVILGLVMGIYCISKASSFITAYPTIASRLKIARSLGSNIGVQAILGIAHHLETVGGYVVWNFLCLMTAAGALWALMITTKTLRGEEDSGRWELFLAGQTSARRATARALAGLGSGLVIIYLLVTLSVLGIGHLHGANFTTSASLFFALALLMGAAEFIAVGALASELMPTRSRAAGLSAAVFGVFYMIRLTADTTNAHWLLNVSPLGWIEKLQPMYAAQPIWLLPIGAFVLILVGLSIFLAGKRDLGGATFADKDSAKPHTWLLSTPLRAAFRLNRAATLGWLFALCLAAFFYGLLSKGAAQALYQSAKTERLINRLTHSQRVSEVTAFMGITFFLIMVLAMFYAASAIGRVRDDEAQGYLDNFMVRPLSRLRWLWGRIGLFSSIVVAVGILTSLATWAGEASQHGGIALHTLLLAGANAMAPVALVFSIGVLIFGFLPRLTAAFTYGAIGWSFLVVMLAGGLNFNHWLLDSSILHQVVFAPAANPNWIVDAIMVGLGLVLCIIGSLRFNGRDLQGE